VIKDHPSETDIKLAKIHSNEVSPIPKKPTPFPMHKIEDDAVIDDILNTLREEENPAHE
jgi:hypothetical protein